MNLIFFRKFPKRVLVLVVGILALLLLSGGVFLFLNREIKGKPSDYVIKDTVQGKIIENKRAGFSAQVPDQWEAKRIEVEEGLVSISSQNTETRWKDNKIILPLEKGCIIHTQVLYQKMSFEEIEKEARYTHYMMGQKFEEFEEISINKNKALKNIFDTEDSGQGVGIYLPKKDKVYSFYLFWALDDERKCIQEFDKFLETVVID
jgi:hypothetical protein